MLLSLKHLEPGTTRRLAPCIGAAGSAQAALGQGDLHQILVRQVPQGRAQRLRQRQVMRWRHQHVQQRHDVTHLGGFRQVAFFRLLCGDTQLPQGVPHHRQAVAAARQHHHFVRLQAMLRQGRCQPARGLAAFQ